MNYLAKQDGAEQWVDFINETIESGEYDWAEETLLDIGATIEEAGKVTTGQERAIKKIIYGQGNW